MASLEEIRKNEPYLLRAINEAIDTIVVKCRNPELQVYVATQLYRAGILTSKNVEKAFELDKKWKMEEVAEQKRRQAEAEAEQRQKNKINEKYARVFNQRKGNPEQLYSYLSSVPTKEVKPFLQELKDRASHWRSVFHGEIHEAIRFLEDELRRRGDSKPAPTTKPKKLPYAT